MTPTTPTTPDDLLAERLRFPSPWLAHTDFSLTRVPVARAGVSLLLPLDVTFFFVWTQRNRYINGVTWPALYHVPAKYYDARLTWSQQPACCGVRPSPAFGRKMHWTSEGKVPLYEAIWRLCLPCGAALGLDRETLRLSDHLRRRERLDRDGKWTAEWQAVQRGLNDAAHQAVLEGRARCRARIDDLYAHHPNQRFASYMQRAYQYAHGAAEWQEIQRVAHGSLTGTYTP